MRREPHTDFEIWDLVSETLSVPGQPDFPRRMHDIDDTDFMYRIIDNVENAVRHHDLRADLHAFPH
jgi:hypothetical protein